MICSVCESERGEDVRVYRLLIGDIQTKMAHPSCWEKQNKEFLDSFKIFKGMLAGDPGR